MATLRSLPYSPAPATPAAASDAHRPSQLPKSLSGPSSLFSSSSSRLPAPAHRRSGSGFSSSRPLPLSLSTSDTLSPSPTRASFLPPTTLFRPARPFTYHDAAAARTSIASASDLPLPIVYDHRDPEHQDGAFPLQPIVHGDTSYDSDADATNGRLSRLSSAEDGTGGGRPHGRDTSTTYSREPLISRPRAGTASSSSAPTAPASASTAAPPVITVTRRDSTDGEGGGGAGKRASLASARAVRDGLERFRRGLSLDSVRRSLSQPGSPFIPSSSQTHVQQLQQQQSTYEPKSGGYPPFSVEGGRGAGGEGVLQWDPNPPPPVPAANGKTKGEGKSKHPGKTKAYPLSATPHPLGARNYTLQRSRNRWLARGRLLAGGDAPWAFLGTLAVLLAVGGVWLGTTCVWWARNLSPALPAVGGYLFALLVSLFFTTAFTDPGILPRDLDPNPPYPPSSPSDGSPRAPYPRDVSVRAGVVRIKYCSTCKIYRPPRASHCRVCDNCVDACDHHCQWVNNCVGRRNYTYFFVLIFMASLTLILVIITSAVHLWLLTRREHISFAHALGRGAGSAVAFSLAIVVFWPVTALLSYHIRLLILNATTIEQIRNQAHKLVDAGPPPPNPFSHGSWRRNVPAVLCRPRGYSWIEPRARATEDRRAINPAYTSEGGDGGGGVGVEEEEGMV